MQAEAALAAGAAREVAVARQRRELLAALDHAVLATARAERARVATELRAEALRERAGERAGRHHV